MAETILGVLKKKLSDEVERLSEINNSGRMGSFEDYKGVCGNIRGLEYAIQEIDDLANKLKGQEND